jgi:hypothetical protein
MKHNTLKLVVNFGWYDPGPVQEKYELGFKVLKRLLA